MFICNMKEYYYTKCFHPRKVKPKYYEHSILVPCGKCAACQSAKSANKVMQCVCESHAHEYEYFITLTYANKFLPTASLVPIFEHYDEPDEHGFTCRHYLQDGYHVVCDQTGEVLGEYYPKNYLDVEMLVKKCNVNNPDSDYKQVPILYKYDVQLFLKRLRKYLKNYSDEKIRYFCCGEYGPIHYRPHYHLELWCEEEETAARFLDAVRECWRFGRIDVSRSFGKSVSYVAKYVNGNCNLPKVFRLAKSQPFNTHSQHLGSSVFTCSTEDFEEDEPNRIKSVSIEYNGEHKTFDMWRNVKHSLFPKCQGFFEKSEQQRCYTYSIYDVTRKWTQTSVCADQARYIASYLMKFGFKSTSPRVEKMLRYFYDSVAYEVSEHQPFNYDKLVNNIYRQILTSKHFLLHICKGNRNLVPYMVNKIDRFYKFKDGELLNHQLKIQQDNDDFVPEFYFPSVWQTGETLFKLKDDANYKLHVKDVNDKLEKSIKHKKLNDLNGIFNYI